MRRLLLLPVLLLAPAALAAATGGAPSSPSHADNLVIPAAEAPLKTTGGRTRPGERPEDGWNLWNNGELGGYVRFADGRYKVVVHASGSPARGDWPTMAVAIDGRGLGRVTVGKDAFDDYAFEANVSAGIHLLTAAFLNDAAVADPNTPGRWVEDRNLYVSRIEVHPLAGAPRPFLSSAQEWAKEAVMAEEKVLAESLGQVERNRKGQAAVRVVDAAGRPLAGAQVSAELVRHEFLFGCNIYMFDRFRSPEQNDLYKTRFAEVFNFATVGFYWRSYEPQRGKPGYDYTDKVVAWCQAKGIRMKGHPLLWGHEAGIPPWSKGQPDAATQRQRVQDILRRYAGQITFWEVVNEPAHIAEPKIDEPYRWARQADANACLIVNDYQVLADGCPAFLELLRKAKASGVPFDGIGIQAHEPRTMRFPLDRVREILDEYAALGKDLYITEFTPTSGGLEITGSPAGGKWDEKAQDDYATKFYRVCFAHPAVKGITWWDLCDQGSWLEGGGLLRKDLSPKPAYESLRRLIREEWITKTAGRTDAEGRFAFRGFAGEYEVSAGAGGKTVKGRLIVRRDASGGKPAECVLTLGP